MTKEQLLELGLSEEQVAKIVEDYGKNYVSKSQFNEKNEELKGVKAQLKEATANIETLKKSSGDNAELTKQIEQMQQAQKEAEKAHKAELYQLRFDTALDKALTSAHAKDTKAVRALLNLENVKLDGDNMVGLQEQLDGLFKSHDYMFSKPTGVGKAGEPSTVENKTITKEQFGKMSYEQKELLYAENEALFNELSKGE